MTAACASTTLAPTPTNPSSTALTGAISGIIPTTTTTTYTYTAEATSDKTGHANVEARVLPCC